MTALDSASLPSRKTASERTLTPRELEILKALAQGSSTRVIAERLFISQLTVRNHVARILTKLRVHNRLAAVAAAYERGLLDRRAPPVRQRGERNA